MCTNRHRLVTAVLAWSLVSFVAAANVWADGTETSAEAVPREARVITNKLCPVMEGNPVDPTIFVTFKGKKVYFCCKTCREKFLDEPNKFLAKLPQFSLSPVSDSRGDLSGEGHEAGHVHEEQARQRGFRPGKLIEPLGILTLVLLLTTACAGILMKKNRKLLFKWHKRMAAATVISALCHAALVLFFH